MNCKCFRVRQYTDIVDECGDFLLQVIMIATIAQEEKGLI